VNRKSVFPPPDLHIHTHFCGHAEGTLDEFVQSAMRKGITEIGFADHFPYPSHYVESVPLCVIPETLFPDYVSEIAEIQEKYKNQITIRFAAEVDYLSETMEETRLRIQKYPFDYVLGSIHILENGMIDYNEATLLEKMDQFGGAGGLWEKYWDAVEGMILSGFCHIVAHFDLPKKIEIAKPVKDYSDRVDHLLDLILKRNLVLEMNTGGIDRTFNGMPYPSERILKQAAEKGVDVTLGSDAHRPNEVGRYFKDAVQLLKTLGFDHVVTLEKGEKITRTL
jgi:histidinol-phosphatase (PHP family)